MPEASDASDAQMGDRLKSTLWYHVGKLVDEEMINLGANATPQYIGSLTELVWAQIGLSYDVLNYYMTDHHRFRRDRSRSIRAACWTQHYQDR